MDAPRPTQDQDETDAADAVPMPADPERAARWAAWRAENAEAIASYNAWFADEGHRYLRKPSF